VISVSSSGQNEKRASGAGESSRRELELPMTGLRPPTRGGPAPPGMAAEVGVEVGVEVGGPRRRGRDDVKEQVAGRHNGCNAV
jgi:hypothetical protein